MTSPKISIGISFKNPGSYFQLALKSIFAQTFGDWELILIDDGSTDDSLTLAKSTKDKRVRVYGDGKSFGLNVRLNQMIQLANAPYFFRMDADDIMHPQRLEKQYQALLQHDENTVIGTAAYSIDVNSHVVGFRASPQKQKFGYAARHSFWHPTVAASTKWFRQNPYSENFIFMRSEDAELWCRTSEKTKFLNLSEPLFYYRESGNFSFCNYLGTSLGLLNIIHDNFNKLSHKYVYQLSKEILKLWIVLILDSFGMTNYLVARRYKGLKPEELQIAHAGLEIIQQQKLPLE